MHEVQDKDRRFYGKLLNSRFRRKKEELKAKLKEAKYVCTTADCWTSRRRSFLALTVHWYTEDLVRKSACLAVRRIKGTHNYSSLAKILEDVHEEYAINKKTTACITDSGSNFIKAFRLFGAQTCPTHGAVEGTIRAALENETVLSESSCSDSNGDSTSETEESVAFQSVSGAINSRESELEIESYSIPFHRKCVCHLLNLIESADLAKIKDRNFIKLFQTVKSKLQKIWNKQKRSSKASDFIQETLGSLFVTPICTRWNSFFTAMARSKSFMLLKVADFKKVFTHFGIAVLRPAEEELLSEYVNIVRPLAEALDNLQADKHVTIGFILPTIVALKSKLRKVEEKGLKHCKPMLDLIFKAIDKRFGDFFQDRELKLASMLHPRFKLNWVEVDERANAEEFFREEVQLEHGTPNPV